MGHIIQRIEKLEETMNQVQPIITALRNKVKSLEEEYHKHKSDTRKQIDFYMYNKNFPSRYKKKKRRV